MTASKPPDKTLVGMPADLKAVLQKLDQAAADKAGIFDKSGAGRAFDPNQTRTGNVPAPRPRSVPPASQPNQQDAHPAVPAPRTAAAAPDAAASMDRTLIGMPSDMQAALQRAIAEQASAPEPQQAAPPPRPAPAPRPQRSPPSAAGPALRAQPVRAIGVPSGPASEAQVPVFGGPAPARTPKPTAAAMYRPAPPPQSLPPLSGLGYQGVPLDPSQPGGMKVLAPQAPLDWPPAALSGSQPGFFPPQRGLGESPDESASEPSMPHAVAPWGSELPTEQPEALQLGTAAFDASGARDEDDTDAQRLAFFEQGHGANPPKRWLAISLIVLAVVAFAAVIALRAPQLLPSGLAAWLAPSRDLPAPAAADAPVLPAAPTAQLTTDTSAATDPVRFTPTPTRPPAAPAMTSGASAQLENKAIERLIANDYPAAKQLYERLRIAEPTRPEFPIMVDLLNRPGAASGARP